MTYVAAVYLAFVLVIGLWAWMQQPEGWRGILSIAALPVLYLLFLLAGNETLSRPKPMPMAWFEALQADDDTDVEVISARMVEGRAIYVWLSLPWTEKPRAYELPWDRGHAEQLHAARKWAEQQGNAQVMMKDPFREANPFRSSQDSFKLFYPDPQPAPPPKR